MRTHHRPRHTAEPALSKDDATSPWRRALPRAKGTGLWPLLVPMLLWLYPPRYSGDKDVLAVIGLYLLALSCDLMDDQIAALTGLVSRHAMKHVIVALAIDGVQRRLRRQQAVESMT